MTPGSMKEFVSYLVDRLVTAKSKALPIIPWSSPIPSFGDVSRCAVATVGINPSNKEFVDNQNNELDLEQRRFHTLRSLGLERWTHADGMHHLQIASACAKYFETNPYGRWFNVLDSVISGTDYSYYSTTSRACHLDLVPFATSCKWSELSTSSRNSLIAISGDALGRIVRDSPIRLLVLNGNSVVTQFRRVCSAAFVSQRKRTWELPRSKGPGVAGHCYQATITSLAGVHLNREVRVLGYNHNIQSSFGVTREVKSSIRRWIARNTQGLLP